MYLGHFFVWYYYDYYDYYDYDYYDYDYYDYHDYDYYDEIFGRVVKRKHMDGPHGKYSWLTQSLMILPKFSEILFLCLNG